MNYYQKQLGKITLASIMLASPILMALPATEAKAAATTTAGKTVEGLIDALPEVEHLTFEKDGQKVMEMQTAYLALNYKEKGNLINQAKYDAIVKKFIADFEAVYKNPSYSEGDLYYFTSSFMNTQKFIANIGNMKDFDDIVLADRTNINTIAAALTIAKPYFEHYIAERTKYTVADIEEAYKKVTMLNNADSLQTKLKALPAVEQLAIADRTKMNTAKTAYNTLNNSSYLDLPEAKAAIEAYQVYEARYAEVETTAYAKMIIDKMQEIGTVDNVTANINDELNTLVTNYGLLLIPSVIEKIDYDLLLEMRERSGRIIASELEAAIQKLSSVDAIKLEDEAEINRIKTVYATIINVQAKGEVVSYDLFLKMQARLTQLKTANDLSTQINALPAVENIKLANYDAIIKIRQSLSTLDEQVQQAMPNYTLFTELEAAVLLLKQDELVQTINDSIEKMTEPTKAELTKIVTNFNLLLADNQEKITNQKKLAQQIARLVALETVMKDSIAFYNTLEPFIAQLSVENQNFEQYANWENYVAKINAYNDQVINLAKIESDINQLPTATTADSKDIVRINKVYEEYTALDDATKALITAKYITKINELYKVAKTLEAQNKITIVINLIEQLPQTLILANSEQVEAANKEFQLLSEDEKKSVTNSEKLQTAIAKITELKMKDLTDLNEALVKLDIATIDITDRSKLTALVESYYKLTAEQQSQIINFDKVRLAEQKITAMYEEVAKMEAEINALNPQQSTVAVKEARAKFNSLTAGQRAFVRNIDVLELYEFFIKEGMTSTDPALNQKLENLTNTQSTSLATTVIALVNKLPEEEKLSLNDLLDVLQAEESFNQLTAINKTKVTNATKLTAVIKKMAALKATAVANGEKIDALINQLPEKITVEQQQELEKIRQEIDEKSIAEQSFITKYEYFLTLEQQLEDIEKNSTKAVSKVIALIAALPATAKLTEAYEEVVNEISASYNQLTDAQKAQVTNEKSLTAAIAKMTVLNADVAGETATVKGKISVPTIKNTTTKFSGTATAKAKVTVYAGKKKLASATVTSKGKYTLKIAKQKKNTTLKFVVTLQNKQLKTTTVTVKAATVQAATSLKATQTKVVGKAKKNTKIKVYKGSKLLKTVTVKANGTFSATVSKQAKKTKLKVVVLDSANNKSTAKTVTVK